MRKLLVFLLLVNACAGKTAPVVVAQATLGLTQSIGQMQDAVKSLNTTGIISNTAALNAQEQLLKVNGYAAKVVPILKALDAAQARGEKVSLTNVELAITLLTEISKELALVMSGIPSQQATQLATIVQSTQQLITTTLVEVARLKAALAG